MPYKIKKLVFWSRFGDNDPNPDQQEPRYGHTKQVENTSIGPGLRRVFNKFYPF
jgi:hypothetical protein